VGLKFAIADYTFPKLKWEQALRLARDLEFEALDLGLFVGRSHLRPEDLFSRPTEATARVTGALRGHGLEVADVFGQAATTFEEYALNHPDAAQRQHATEFFWRLLEFAARCNAKHLSLLPGVHFERESYETSLGRCADELAWRAEAASKLGIVFAVELHVGSVAPTPSEGRRLLEMVPGLTLTLDYTHFTFQGIPDHEIEPLLACASQFHARGACAGKLQASSRENTIDYPRIITAMKESGYEGYVVLEYVWTEWMRCNELDNLTETIWLRDLLRSANSNSKAHKE
jgi:sugar phosphate isomerase/epimerase